MVVYAKVPYAYVWADNNGTHKQGKVFPEQVLTVSSEKGNGYWLVEPELDRPIAEGYEGKFWIFKEDTVESHGNNEDTVPIPVPDPIGWAPGDWVTFEQAAKGLAVFLKWFKQ